MLNNPDQPLLDVTPFVPAYTTASASDYFHSSFKLHHKIQLYSAVTCLSMLILVTIYLAISPKFYNKSLEFKKIHRRIQPKLMISALFLVLGASIMTYQAYTWSQEDGDDLHWDRQHRVFDNVLYAIGLCGVGFGAQFLVLCQWQAGYRLATILSPNTKDEKISEVRQTESASPDQRMRMMNYSHSSSEFSVSGPLPDQLRMEEVQKKLKCQVWLFYIVNALIFILYFSASIFIAKRRRDGFGFYGLVGAFFGLQLLDACRNGVWYLRKQVVLKTGYYFIYWQVFLCFNYVMIVLTNVKLGRICKSWLKRSNLYFNEKYQTAGNLFNSISATEILTVVIVMHIVVYFVAVNHFYQKMLRQPNRAGLKIVHAQIEAILQENCQMQASQERLDMVNSQIRKVRTSYYTTLDNLGQREMYLTLATYEFFYWWPNYFLDGNEISVRALDELGLRFGQMLDSPDRLENVVASTATDGRVRQSSFKQVQFPRWKQEM